VEDIGCITENQFVVIGISGNALLVTFCENSLCFTCLPALCYMEVLYMVNSICQKFVCMFDETKTVDGELF
jgi:hypothetical protein